VKVKGLLFSAGPPTGTVGPITHVRASLTCEGTGVVASTGPVPLSAEGKAKIKAFIAVPSSCIIRLLVARKMR